MHLYQVLEQVKLPFELADLQKEDIQDAAACRRFGWFLDVGVGKTVCSTLTAMMLDEDHTVIVCPPILNQDWAGWLRSIGQTDVGVYEGPRRKTEILGHKWVVMSHAIFRDSFDTILDFFTGKNVNVIVDEAQAAKSPQSQLFKKLLKFIGPDRAIQLLTATPTSKPEDTYTYMRIKTPQTYRSFGHWGNLHIGAKDIFGTITKYNNLEMLAENFAVNAVKRTKQQVFGHNLDPIYQPIHYNLSPKHKNLYEKLAEEQLLLLETGEKIDATTAQKLRHALQQIVLNFSKFSGNPADKSAAYDILEQTLEEVDPMDVNKSKLVVWTYYVASSESVTAYLQQKFGSKAVVAAYGKVDSRKAVDAIMHDPECRILVAQPSSVGVGLNLHHVCSEMLFLEMSTTPMQMRQAIGRVDRAGQKVRPTIRFGQALGTIQLKLFRDLLNNDDLVSKVERTVKSLRDEIFGK